MKDFKEAYRALAPLREAPLPVEERSSAARAAVLRHLNGILASVPQPAPRRWPVLRWALAAGLSATVAAAAATWVVQQRTPARSASAILDLRPRGRVSLFAEGRTHMEVAAQTRVPANGLLTTSHESGVDVVTPTGLNVTVGGDSELSLSELGDGTNGVLYLTRGSVECRVPKQAPGSSFSVVTPDITVVVHGTVFSVELTPNSAEHRTCVRVSEGVVLVRRSRSVEELRGGESSGCDVDTLASVPSAVPTASASAKLEKRVGPRSDEKSRAAAAAGSLVAESELLRQALLAEQRGELAAAGRSLDLLLARYPQSALASEARRVRLRLNRNQVP